jgi:hypothetical protein
MAVGILECAASAEEMEALALRLRPCIVDKHCLAYVKCCTERARLAQRLLQTFAQSRGPRMK